MTMILTNKKDVRLLALVVAITFVGFSLWQGYEVASCIRMAEKMKMAYSWGPYQGCMVEYETNKWVPIEQYKVVMTD